MDDLNRTAWELWRAGDARDAVESWVKLAERWRRAGQLDEAMAVVRTLVHLTEGGDSRLQRVAWYAMAETQCELGEPAEATRWVRRALETHEALDDRRAMADDLASLGELAEEGGDLEQAVAVWSQALALLDTERSAEAVHDLLLALGRGYAGLGNEVLAATCAACAEQLAVRWAE
jgi:tetratricopeptide (TPR) repeat protein